ncbi:MAG: hypothetical protein ACYDAJ_04025 [Nitrosotalea sp.]
MKTLHYSVIAILVLCNSGIAYAQYGLYGQEALDHQHILQEQLDLARTHIEMSQQEEQQAKDIRDAIILAEVGIPIATGVSTGVFLFARKKK